MNECERNPCGSNSQCINTIGSYFCSCLPGFRLSTRNQNLCIDINECSENTHSCAQKCVNTVGSFYCQCELGYQPNPLDRNRCEVDTTINPCDLLSSKNITCQHNCRSILEDGQIKSECFCRSGYRLKNDGMNCEDIDECEEKLCSQNCSNLVGNYTCSCYPGYRLIGRQVCEECAGITYGMNCLKTCNCKGRALRCDKVKGCICRSNWKGENCDEDVNECIENPTICRKDQICVNSEGSYSCICVNGYEEANGTCTNINECENATLNSCEQKCGDTNGSYVCSCEDGYTKNGSTECKDVDECKLGLSACEQLCINNKGSYSCGCYDGYTLQDDRRKCFRDLDLCLSTNINCSYGCSLVNKTAVCFCENGYELATNNLDCIDINECESDSPLCFNKESCNNLPGKYTCFCQVGYKLQNDQRSCLPCDEYHWGPECSNACDCFPRGSNSCDPITGCVCKAGWAGEYCDEDKNECSSNTTSLLCPEYSNCINTVGSYFCRCKPGYLLSNETCIGNSTYF
ncbi:hypothetical protein Btru_068323 [Bulinus truncatus]|nr:hypothetical protein Btru_068323 [Bulinus truncatus]